MLLMIKAEKGVCELNVYKGVGHLLTYSKPIKSIS
jgi:hypothetical protein